MRERVLVSLLEQPDIEVVGVIKGEDGIVDAVERMRPGVLIIALHGKRCSIFRALLSESVYERAGHPDDRRYPCVSLPQA
jgi:hypothetical protein